MQGIGVRTPRAAEVAAATAGFASEVHMPKGMMFTMGLLSMMFASGWFPVFTRFTGKTTKLLGAMPMLHWRVAPLQTCWGMRCSLLSGMGALICAIYDIPIRFSRSFLLFGFCRRKT